jgi:hypothetical protein
MTATTYSLLRLILRTTTRLRDSHGLFDFEARSVQRAIISCNEAGFITREGDLCSLRQREGDDDLAFVSPGDGESWVVSSASSCFWVVVKSLTFKKHQGHLLAEGDLIKFGLELFRVKQISADGNATPCLPSLGESYEEPETPEK